MEGGWIKLHRKMRQWQYYQCPSVRLVFEELLFCANSGDAYFHGERVGRGETVVGVRTISKYTGYSVRIVVEALKKLVESGEIKREKCWRGIKTTIINFEKYQNKSVLESETLSETLSETEGETESETFSETLSDTEQEYNKNNKKHKNKEELDTNVSSSVEVSPDQKPTKEEKIDFSGLLEFFNKTMESSNAVVPKIKSMSERRKKNIRARVREHGKRAVFEVITKAGTSDFLNGRNKNGWVADFDWIFRPNNFPKVLEGNYDNRPNTQINGNNRTSTFQEQRAAELTKLDGYYSPILALRLAEDDARH